MPTDARLIEISGLAAFYGPSQVLHGVGLHLAAGEIVTIVGRNGAGKSTTLKTIMGILKAREGSIRIGGVEVVGLAPERIARLGIGYVPEDRGIFASLNVTENLMLPPVVAPGGLTLEEIYRLFPNLAERGRSPGSRLSGGEQQMLAIARVLRTGAKILLLDEPTEGLAPVIIEQIGAVFGTMREKGLTVLLVEQNLNFAAEIADRHYVMESGRIIDEIARADLAANMQRLQTYLTM